MNARQKAKKYKKMAERYKDKAEAWDRQQRTELYKHAFRRGYGTVETLKVAKRLDYRVLVDEEFLKKEMAMELAEALLREGYINFKVDDEFDEYTMASRMTATLKVTKGDIVCYDIYEIPLNEEEE